MLGMYRGIYRAYFEKQRVDDTHNHKLTRESKVIIIFSTLFVIM